MLPEHRILREVLRNFLTLRDHVTQTGEYMIEYAGVTISYPDLLGALTELSKRKKEAVMYNVIMDMKQKDVAEIMGITTVSVGQYVEQGMLQVSKTYFEQHPVTQ